MMIFVVVLVAALKDLKDSKNKIRFQKEFAFYFGIIHFGKLKIYSYIIHTSSNSSLS